MVHGAQALDCRCNCAAFAFSDRGSCEHIEFVLETLLAQPESAQVLLQGRETDYSEVLVRYGARRQLRWRAGRHCPDALLESVQALVDENGRLRAEVPGVLNTLLQTAAEFGHELRVEEGVWPLLAHRRDAAQRVQRLEQAYPQGLESPALHDLLKLPLPIYQIEAALFAVCAGRSLLADDLGLGQHACALAAAELLMRHFGAERVLVLCAAPAQARWLAEAQTLSPRQARVVAGDALARSAQLTSLKSGAELTICDVANLAPDFTALQSLAPDLIIVDAAASLDAAQLTLLKQLKHEFLVLLNGTLMTEAPLQLLPLVDLLDLQRTGPYARFLSHHVQRDAQGHVQRLIGLDSLDQTLERVMFARSRSELAPTLPPALLQLRPVALNSVQMAMQAPLWQALRQTVQRWQRSAYVSDAELLQITRHLQALRRVAISAELLSPAEAITVPAGVEGLAAAPKLTAVVALAQELLGLAASRLVVFCQWDDALALLARCLEAEGLRVLHLQSHQSLVQRQNLARRWRDDESVQVLLCSDGAAAGLDLLARTDASLDDGTVAQGVGLVNLELPWSEALLAQRLARVSQAETRGMPLIQLFAQASLEQQMLLAMDQLPELPASSLDGDISLRLLQGEALQAFMQALALLVPQDA
nr:helicase-related protein [Roseateles koreensis]